MRRRTSTYRSDHTLEECGKGQQVCVELECIWRFSPSEPMVRYYPDGSGYPGAPAVMELVEVWCSEATGENWRYRRQERPDWFAWLDDAIADRYLDTLNAEADEQLVEETYFVFFCDC